MAYWHKERRIFWLRSMVDLSGINVINTRPLARADALQTALLATGAIVAQLPLLETETLALSAEARQSLLDLDRYRWVFVVSPTAAELGLQHLGDYWPQWPIAVDWLAVGESTAQVLRQALLNPIVPDEESSEGLLRLPVFQQRQMGDRLLVLRGEGGRNLVRDSLDGQGVGVDYVELYRRRLPPDTMIRWQQLISTQGLPDIVILTSGESLQHWLAIAGEAAMSVIPLVISPRLAVIAQKAGLKPCIIAASTRPEAIIDALLTWRNSLNHDIDCTEPTERR
jgi:uroporphyrinogen-III synthase